jgi:hypothetical protein
LAIAYRGTSRSSEEAAVRSGQGTMGRETGPGEVGGSGKATVEEDTALLHVADAERPEMGDAAESRVDHVAVEGYWDGHSRDRDVGQQGFETAEIGDVAVVAVAAAAAAAAVDAEPPESLYDRRARHPRPCSRTG